MAAAVASWGAAVGVTRAFFVGAMVGEASRAGVSTTATAGPAVEAPIASDTFAAGGGWVGTGAGMEAAGAEVGTGGSSPTSFSLFFESASTPSTTAATARRPPPRTKGETPFFFGGDAAAPAAFATASPMRRPVVIGGDSESGSGAATAGIDAIVGADVTASSADFPSGPAFPTGIDTRIAAVGAFDARTPGGGGASGATGGGVPDGGRPRLTLFSENPAVEPTGEKPSAPRR